MRRWAGIIALTLLCGAWTHGNNGHIGASTYKIGAGGAIKHVDIASDGTKLITTDVYGAYVCAAPCTTPNFQQIINATSIPSPSTWVGPLGTAVSSLGAGAYDARIAPSSTQTLYMIWNGKVWRSANQGRVWVDTGATQDGSADPNNATFTGLSRRLAVAPFHPNSVISCTPTNGCINSINANAGTPTWTPLPSITAATAGYGYLVAYDLSDATDNTAFIASYGAGIFKCTALQTLSPSCAAAGTGSPTTFQFMLVDASGNVWETDQSVNSACGNVNKFAHGGSSWSVSLGTGTACAEQLAVNGSLLYALANNGNQLFVLVSGTWSAANTNGTPGGTDIPWVVAQQARINPPPVGLYANDAAFDPNTGFLYAAGGLGLWQTNPPTTITTVTITWNDFSAAVEELVANKIISPPGGTPIFAGWDQGVIDNPNGLTAYALTNPAGGALANHTAWDVDYCTFSPNSNPALITNPSLDVSGILNNGAGTFAPFSTAPSAHGVGVNFNGGGGGIACQTPLNIVAVGIDSNSLTNTLTATADGGATWTAATYAGTAPHTAAGSCTGWGSNVSHRLIADRGGSIYYAYNDWGNNSNCVQAATGIWKSTNGGLNWSLDLSVQFDSGFTSNSQMAAVPGVTGEFLFASGVSGATPAGTASHLWDCVDGSPMVCTQVANVGMTYAVGLGVAKPGGSGFPSIYIYGNVTQNGGVSYTLGLWRSDDHASTWTLLQQYPNNSIDWVKTVAGDNNIYGRVYVGFAGSGMAQYN